MPLTAGPTHQHRRTTCLLSSLSLFLSVFLGLSLLCSELKGLVVEGELDALVRHVARRRPRRVAQRARPAKVDGVAEDAVGLDATQDAADLGPPTEDALLRQAVLRRVGLLARDVDDRDEGGAAAPAPRTAGWSS
jgi:hypothetical protein